MLLTVCNIKLQTKKSNYNHCQSSAHATVERATDADNATAMTTEADKEQLMLTKQC